MPGAGKRAFEHEHRVAPADRRPGETVRGRGFGRRYERTEGPPFGGWMPRFGVQRHADRRGPGPGGFHGGVREE